jgi:hypothetical protein
MCLKSNNLTYLIQKLGFLMEILVENKRRRRRKFFSFLIANGLPYKGRDEFLCFIYGYATSYAPLVFLGKSLGF